MYDEIMNDCIQFLAFFNSISPLFFFLFNDAHNVFLLFLGISDPANYPAYVLAIHSSKRLLVEQISPPAYILADAIISLTLAKGQRHEVSEDVFLKFILQGDCFYQGFYYWESRKTY